MLYRVAGGGHSVLKAIRVQVREIDDAEGQRLLRIIRRGTGSMATWRRAQMVLLSAQGMPVAKIAEVIWPGLKRRCRRVLATLPDEGSLEFVWEMQAGTIRHPVVDDTDHRELAALVADARAACALPVYLDEHHPLLCAALPDSDGVSARG